jgi:hypothetical protein
MAPGDPGYTPELDVKRSRDERAQFYKGLFTFYVAPNSLLAMNAMEQKMLYTQLSRMGYLDFWTLMDKLEIPNVGQPPMIPDPSQPPTQQPVVDPMTGQPAVDPRTGQPLMQLVPAMKVPTTITEKLVAQQQLGIGMTVSPAGRKASGEAPPKMESKDGGSRTTISESK